MGFTITSPWLELDEEPTSSTPWFSVSSDPGASDSSPAEVRSWSSSASSQRSRLALTAVSSWARSSLPTMLAKSLGSFSWLSELGGLGVCSTGWVAARWLSMLWINLSVSSS